MNTMKKTLTVLAFALILAIPAQSLAQAKQAAPQTEEPTKVVIP